MDSDTLKVEVEAEACCVCGAAGEELFSPEEHDAAAPDYLPPLRAMMLHLNHSKTVPSGRLCSGCIRKTTEAYNFSTTLASKGPPPLSEKIRALRKRLHELTQKIDVFIVVGGGGANGAYSEEDIIMVERDALAAATRADEAELLRVRNMKGENVYQCTVCPLTFQRATEYQTHCDTHPADSVHSCWSCGAQFTSAEAVTAHCNARHAPATAHCYICNQTFQSQTELRRHESSCPAQCPVCGVPLPSRAALRSHAAQHRTLCALCYRAFPTPEELHAHALYHRQEKQFICGYDGCILRFATRNNLISHIRKCHSSLEPPQLPQSEGEDDATVPCAHCTRRFATPAAMKRHARVHRSIQNDNTLPEQPGMEEPSEEEAEGKIEYLEVETLDEMEEILPF